MLWPVLDYLVGRVHVVVWGWPWVVIHHLGGPANLIETLKLTSFLEAAMNCGRGNETL